MPKVAVVIVTYNAGQYLPDCFSSLQQIDYSAESFRIIIVDNNSTDGTVKYIKDNFPQCHLIESKTNLGFAGGNNIGFQYALDNGYDYVFALNQDTVVDSDFLRQALAVAESDNNIGSVQSKLLLYGQDNKINSVGNQIHYLGFAYAGGHQTVDVDYQIKEITYSSGAAVLYRMKALQEVGFFNEELFMYHEDTDLGWRLWLAGWRSVLAPASVVYHKYQFSRSITKYYFMERNRYIVMLQNYHLATLFVILPMIILAELMMLGYSFVTGWWKEKIRAWFYFLHLGNIKKIIAIRKKIQVSRKITDKAMVGRFVSVIDFQEIKNPLVNNIFNPLCSVYWFLVKRLIFW